MSCSTLFCRLCGVSRPFEAVATEYGYPPSEGIGPDLPFAALSCTACSRATVDRGFRLEEDGSMLPPSNEARCCVEMATRSALTGHRQWGAWLSPQDMQRLEDIMQGEQVSCTASLIAGTTNQLPSHVCLRTAMTTCDLTFRGYAEYFARCGTATTGSETDTTGLLAEAFVLPRIMEEIWRENGDAPWPVPLSLHLLVGLVAPRSCPAGSLTLLAPMTLAGDNALVFDEPLIHVYGDRSSVDLQMLQKDVVDWYRRSILGQRVRRRGRPVGSAPLLNEIRPVYTALVERACRRFAKSRDQLTPGDLVLEAQVAGIEVAEQTIAGWWRDDKLPDPTKIG